ncbi:DUF3006 domain-containing protein [Clostridium taeniosporum]|uniref:DUF3006 domain-containing protein n=1 Tax=Clostridium taeniosporum TaxID=394958 RepID=A0A1D7XMW9_9CLOT|nr:DUF3006 domain-containing protein [Clostridium taeniosporum]AOR24617.1 DUF3006 domain-containing protein [Clostridium taeniosporum]
MVDKYIVDRIEENYVVIESSEGEIIEVSLSNIKGNIRDGDVLIKKEDVFIIDKEETLKRKQAINNMMKNMWE